MVLFTKEVNFHSTKDAHARALLKKIDKYITLKYYRML